MADKMNEMMFQQNKNLVYAWLETLQAKTEKTKTAPEIYGADADQRSRKALWLTHFVLADVLGLTEEEALARAGVLDEVRLGKFINRPFIRIPLLDDEFINLSSSSRSPMRPVFEQYVIRYAYSNGNPEKMLALYHDICNDTRLRNTHKRKDTMAKSIRRAERMMK